MKERDMNKAAKVIINIKWIGAITLLSAIQVFPSFVPGKAMEYLGCEILGERDPSVVFPSSFEPLVNRKVDDNGYIIIGDGTNNQTHVQMNDSSVYLSSRLYAMQEQFSTFPPEYNNSSNPCYKKFMRAYTKAAKKTDVVSPVVL
jgi:hypothetical protein